MISLLISLNDSNDKSKYRISRNSGRGSYHFAGQILPQNWVYAVLILGAVIIKSKNIYIVKMLFFHNKP